MIQYICRGILGSAIVVAVVGMGLPAQAAPVTIGQANAIASFGFDSVADGALGQYHWEFHVAQPTVNHMTKEWFWIRIGNSGPEFALDNDPGNGMLLSFVVPSDADPLDGVTPDHVVANYFVSQGGASMGIEFAAELHGQFPTSLASDLAETLTITNFSSDAVTINVFHLVDFQLNGTAADDTALFDTSNPLAPSWRTFDGATDSRTVVTYGLDSSTSLQALRGEVNTAANLYAKLNDGDADNLSNVVSPVTGDVAWAVQWTFRLGGIGQSFEPKSVVISIDKPLGVPEPSSLALLGVAGVLSGVRRSRR